MRRAMKIVKKKAQIKLIFPNNIFLPTNRMATEEVRSGPQLPGAGCPQQCVDSAQG